MDIRLAVDLPALAEKNCLKLRHSGHKATVSQMSAFGRTGHFQLALACLKSTVSGHLLFLFESAQLVYDESCDSCAAPQIDEIRYYMMSWPRNNLHL
jgi:hypothetical protein